MQEVQTRLHSLSALLPSTAESLFFFFDRGFKIRECQFVARPSRDLEKTGYIFFNPCSALFLLRPQEGSDVEMSFLPLPRGFSR